MTDTARVPRHLQVLGEAWANLAHRLDRDIAAAMPIVTDCLERAQYERFRQLASRESSALKAWIERVTAWMNGPLAQALTNADIPDPDMRRVAERLSHFADELIERRDGLQDIVTDPAMRAAAPRFDAVYVALLKQVGDFVSQVVAALGPAASGHPNARREGTNIELSFTFTPDIAAEMTQYAEWMENTQSGWNGASSSGQPCCASLASPGRAPESTATLAAATSSEPWKAGATVLCVLLALVALGMWGMAALWVMFAIAVLIWCIRRPWIVLMALLLNWFFGS